MFNTNSYNSRYFNDIVKVDNFLIKSSTNINKIKSEYSYYYYLPQSLQRYFVQPFDLKIKNNVASYKMELINYKNLAQLFSSEYVSISSFNNMLDSIDLFKKNTYVEDNRLVLENAKYLVLEKTKSRISKLDEFQNIYNRLSNAFDFFIKKRSTWNLVLSHGDLCFSNIIWIKEINMLKMIDPRGAKNKDDLFMDEYYDLAKLHHSIFGNYESIIYNFNIDYEHIKSPFLKYLNKKNICLELLKVYEAALFISMIPLHIDNPQNAKSFAVTCDRILKEIGF
jgi:hypothetical protein